MTGSQSLPDSQLKINAFHCTHTVKFNFFFPHKHCRETLGRHQIVYLKQGLSYLQALTKNPHTQNQEKQPNKTTNSEFQSCFIVQ